jgi:hypothetical protein
MDRKAALIELRDKVKAGKFGTPDTPHCDLTVVHLIQAYSGSLDAAKALHEVVLPGWGWEISNEDTAAVFYGNSLSGPCKISASDNPARAWLLAILDALIAEESEK